MNMGLIGKLFGNMPMQSGLSHLSLQKEWGSPITRDFTQQAFFMTWEKWVLFAWMKIKCLRSLLPREHRADHLSKRKKSWEPQGTIYLEKRLAKVGIYPSTSLWSVDITTLISGDKECLINLVRKKENNSTNTLMS